MRIVAISDTHLYHHRLIIPECDILIHAGDFSMRADLKDTIEFAAWMNSQPAKTKIVVPGNHDIYCYHERHNSQEIFGRTIFVTQERINVQGLSIFCHSWTPEIYKDDPRWVFTASRTSMIFSGLEQASYCDIVVSHGPPKGILDSCDEPSVGEAYLFNYVSMIKPRVHIFGHIHESYGHVNIFGTDFYNVSICDGMYNPINPITVIDI